MTVKELITTLQQFSQDDKVFMEVTVDKKHEGWCEITGCRHSYAFSERIVDLEGILHLEED